MNAELKNNLESFFQKSKLIKLKKGEVILKPGDKPKYVGFLKSGYVRMYSVNEAGVETTVQFFKPILYLTIIFACTGRENQYYFETITPVEMYTVPEEEMKKYLLENPDISKELMICMMNLFLDSIDHCNFLLSGNAYNKVAKMVKDLTMGKDSFGITHKLIASLTGLTRETVTLQMLKLEKNGIIENRNKKVFVHDWDRLEGAINKAD